MILLIAGIVVIIGALVASHVLQNKLVAIVGAVVGVLIALSSCFYTQEVGEAVILKNADGTIARTDTTSGWDLKAPWQSKIAFDIKGQQAQYKLDGNPTQDNEVVQGPTITVTGKDKVPVDVDISIGYSIDGESVADLYTEYKTEEAMFERLITTSIKSIVKDSANPMTVDELITNRAAYAAAIQENLETAWKGKGITVDLVSLQTIRPPQSIIDRINESQVAQQQLIQAEAQTKVKEEEARQRVAEANGIADANRILNDSLTDKVLQDKYIDALKNAESLVVVPDGSTPMVGVPQK